MKKRSLASTAEEDKAYEEYLAKQSVSKEDQDDADYQEYLRSQGQEPTQEIQHKYSPGEAALYKWGSGITAGYLPEMQAGVGQLIPGSNYEKDLAQYRQMQKDISQEYPTLSPVSEIGGSIHQAVLGAAGASKLMNYLSKIKGAATAAETAATAGTATKAMQDNVPMVKQPSELTTRINPSAEFEPQPGSAGISEIQPPKPSRIGASPDDIAREVLQESKIPYNMGDYIKQKAINTGKFIGTVGGAGAAGGFIQNPETEPGQKLTPEEEMQARKEQALSGGKAALALGTAAKGIGKFGQAATSKMGDIANSFVLSTIGLTKPVLKKLNLSDKTGNLLDTVQRYKLVRTGSDANSISQEASKHLESIGNKIGEVYDHISGELSKIDLNPEEKHMIYTGLYDRIMNAAKENTPNVNTDVYLSKMKNIVNSILAKQKNGLNVQDLNKSYKDLFQYVRDIEKKSATEMDSVKQGYLSVMNALRETLNDTVSAVGKKTGNPELVERIRNLNNDYHYMSIINKSAAGERAADMLGRNAPKLAAIGGAGLGMGIEAMRQFRGSQEFEPSKILGAGLLYGAGGLGAYGGAKLGSKYVLPVAKDMATWNWPYKLSDALASPGGKFGLVTGSQSSKKNKE